MGLPTAAASVEDLQRLPTRGRPRVDPGDVIVPAGYKVDAGWWRGRGVSFRETSAQRRPSGATSAADCRAPAPDGQLFSVERLAEFIERQAANGLPAPETLRRLRAAIIERGEGSLRDDATALLLEWRRTERALLPDTV